MAIRLLRGTNVSIRARSRFPTTASATTSGWSGSDRKLSSEPPSSASRRSIGVSTALGWTIATRTPLLRPATARASRYERNPAFDAE